MHRIDVIIPVYGHPELLDECLGVLPVGDDVNIIVIDDASPDVEPIEHLVRDKYHLPFFKNRVNTGFPGTVNKGVRKGSAPLIVVLNTDVVLEPSALGVLMGEMEDPSIGIAAPMLLFADGSQHGPAGHIQHVGMAFNIIGTPIHLFVGWSSSNPRAVQRRENLPCVTGACFMTRRSIWKTIGGFQEAYGRGTYEDVEYCIAVNKVIGKKIVCNPKAVGFHLVGASSADSGKAFDLYVNSNTFNLRMRQFIKHDEYLFW